MALSPSESRVPQAPDLAILVFELGTARFGLDAFALHEVVRAVAISALPHAPPIVEGVINVRGRVVPVLDIRQRFGLAYAPLRADQCFLIAQAGHRTVALRVDRATELITVSVDVVQPATPTVPGAEYIAGIATLPDGLIVIHDVNRFLSLDESACLNAALDTPSAARDAETVA